MFALHPVNAYPILVLSHPNACDPVYIITAVQWLHASAKRKQCDLFFVMGKLNSFSARKIVCQLAALHS